jgi:hypothetical protein
LLPAKRRPHWNQARLRSSCHPELFIYQGDKTA